MAYERLTMEEVRAVAGTNGRVAVSSFSGCGGSSTGLKMAGFDVQAAIEFIPAAADTYEANYPETKVYRDDIRKLEPEKILADLGLEPGELDLYEGSPPCASFSAAGMRERGWGTEKKYSDTVQATDDLFEHYCRMVEGLRPKAFIAENVPGMEMGDAKAYLHAAGNRLRELGYSVDARVVNAKGFGVPQERKRLIFIGFRNDLGIEARVPTTGPDPHVYTLAEALADVEPNDPDHAPYLAESSMESYAVGRTWEAHRGFRSFEDCARCGERLGDPEHHARDTEFVGAVKKGKQEDGPAGLFEMEPEGGRKREFYTCKKDGQRATEVKRYFLLVVPDPNKPCPTLTATGAQPGAASVTHPTECRKFTPAEAKALGGFPADFILTGTREQRYERMGRTVVPPLYEVMGTYIAAQLDAAEAWRCESCGATENRYDNGDACDACVETAFAEAG